MCVDVGMYKWVQEPSEARGFESPRDEVTHCFKPPHVGARNWTQGLCRADRALSCWAFPPVPVHTSSHFPLYTGSSLNTIPIQDSFLLRTKSLMVKSDCINMTFRLEETPTVTLTLYKPDPTVTTQCMPQSIENLIVSKAQNWNRNKLETILTLRIMTWKAGGKLWNGQSPGVTSSSLIWRLI